MNNPMISFIIPVYNRENTVPATVKSITDSSFEDYDIVLVDNASTDGSGAICDKLSASDQRIRVVHVAVNRGAGGARNLGMTQARGDFLHFCDSDDEVDGTVLPKIAQCLRENPDIDVLTTNHREKAKDGSHTVYILDKEEKCTMDKLLEKKPSLLHLGFWRSFFSRRFLLENNLTFPEIKEHEDLYFNGLALLRAKTVCTMPDAFYQYNRFFTGNSVVANSDADESAVCFDSCIEVFGKLTENSSASKLQAIHDFVYASAMYLLGNTPLDTILRWEQAYGISSGNIDVINLSVWRRAGIRGSVADLWEQIRRSAEKAVAGNMALYLAPAGGVSISIAKKLAADGTTVSGFLDNAVKRSNYHIALTQASMKLPVSGFDSVLSEHSNKKCFILITGSINTALSISRQLNDVGLKRGIDFISFIR
jgi:glycosyltransferase involved in cell wall biosynthesis